MARLNMLADDLFTANRYRKRSRTTWTAWFICLLGLSAIAAVALFKLTPKPAFLAWMLYGIGMVAILFRPRYGLYLTLFFSLVGDSILLPWYPSFKNFSSRESIFFLSDSLIFSPLELCLLITLVSWLIRAIVTRQYSIKLGELFWPAAVFIIFILFGMLYGVARGGNLTIALWEARPIFYLFLMLVMVTNLIVQREHVNTLMWSIVSALVIEGMIGIYVFIFVFRQDLSSINSLTEHSAAIHMNTVFVLIVAAWLYKASVAKRFLLPLLVSFMALTYLLAQRRAAFVSLGLAFGLILILLFFENRRLFWQICIPMTFLGLVYFVIFWNSSSALALPVQAVKSVIAPSQASTEDQLSNIYRVLENLNTSFTIHAAPLTGVGFGNRFYIIVPMPDISNFSWWEYITHNSILWIWMKAGVFGFGALLYFIGNAVMLGTRNVLLMPQGDLRAFALVAVTYICMHFLYAYVDMSWDAQSMLYVGAMLGLINSMQSIAQTPIPAPAKRWPWQN
jgi:hypothetical protein